MSDTETLVHILTEFAFWHEMQREPFRPRAYQNAADTVAALGHEVKEAWKQNGAAGLCRLPHIGEAIAKKIDEYFRTGHIRAYDHLKKQFPVDIWELSQIQGLGPHHILALYEQRQIRNTRDLAKAVAAHRIQDLPGFGVKSEEKIKRALVLARTASSRKLLGHVLPIADKLVEALSRVKGVQQCAYAGSLRRKQETIGDIDLIVTAKNPKIVMDAFIHFPGVEHVHEHGKTRSSVRLSIGIDADLRVVPNRVYGAALQYFTGDKRHNILLRERAIRNGYLLNEYGLFKEKKLVTCASEEAIYAALGLETPAPEIRVGRDELEAAARHALPCLLPYGSVRGDLQVQTDWTDGTASIRAMAEAAQKHNLEYIAVTDHTKSLAFIGGLDEKKLAKQGREIDRLNMEHGARSIKILKGAEANIKTDGSLDLDDACLQRLDFVGISIHSRFGMSEAEATKRVIKAMQHPSVDCLFHPTGRLIGKREAYPLDMKEVLAAAKKYRVALEINAVPDRSDLRDIHVRMAVDAGVPLIINSDAHHPDHFDYLSLGEAIARRGWATKKDILNTKTFKPFYAWLEKKRKRTMIK